MGAIPAMDKRPGAPGAPVLGNGARPCSKRGRRRLSYACLAVVGGMLILSGLAMGAGTLTPREIMEAREHAGRLNKARQAKCEVCNGSGKVYPKPVVACRHCGGRGQVVQTQGAKPVVCGSCKGQAGFQEVCGQCRGKGQYTEGGKGYACGMCNGRGGFTKTARCGVCKGKGQVLRD